jgi:hypothetical protein
MEKFKIKAYVVDEYEDELEADSVEEAQEKMLEKIENSELETRDGTIFFDGDKDHSKIQEIIDSQED